jgi:hypothetical protein
MGDKSPKNKNVKKPSQKPAKGGAAAPRNDAKAR